MTTNEILSRLEHVKKSGDGWMARCPAHDDNTPSLSVKTGDDGRTLLNCKAGCQTETICAALGVKLADLFIDRPQRNGQPKKIVAHYDYTDADENLIFQVCRFEPKDFRQRRPDPTGPEGWRWDTKGVNKILFRLPKILAAIKEGLPIYLTEGEKDVLAMEQNGFAASCNPGGAGKWLDSYTETLRGADIIIVADRDKAGREHAQLVAGKLYGVARTIKVIELPDMNGQAVKDAADFFAAGGEAADLYDLAQVAPEFDPAQTAAASGDDLQRALADARPKIRLPGPDRLLSDFGRELGEILRVKDIYLRNGEVVVLADGQLKAITPQAFRCWAEQFFIGYRAKTIGENTFEFNVTMTDTEARGTLAAPQFVEGLRPVRRINHAILPTIGKDGKLTLFPKGYEVATGTLTLADVVYDFDLPIGDAKETLDDLLREFCFADGERSKGVAIAAMMGIFASQLVPEKSLRPCFVFVGNAEGCGKSLLTQVCIVPTLGAMPTGSKANDDDEIRKALTTAIREASPVIVFDNIKGRLSSEALEAFLSAPIWNGRKLGVNENIKGENVSTVFLTGNGMTVSPDMRRRSLFVELHLEAERAEDRIFSRLLDLPRLLELRPKMLAALWSLVKFWDMRGRPGPSRSHSAFPSWANIIGGIVEAAGFSCPLETAAVSAAADPDGEAMRNLVKAMANKPAPLTFGELIALSQEQGLFEAVIGSNEGDIDRRAKAALSRLLGRYDRRLVLDWRFVVEGQGRSRRYRAEPCHARHARHAISDDKLPLYAREPHPETP